MTKLPQEINTSIQDVHQFWEDFKDSFDDFSKKIGTTPKASNIKNNPYANNSKYLEIGFIEMQLDRIYHGQWSFEVTEVKLLLNAIQVTGHLSVLHPVSGTWIKRSGISAKECQLKKGSTSIGVESLSSKAMERDVPIAKAEAFKNACKSLGNAFGRSLNRNFNHDFIPDLEVNKYGGVKV